MRTSRGFTVIEVMLFLAVTGVIMSTLLVGLTVGINRARYKDAVSSYQSYWQGQYDEATNVVNNRSRDNPCIDGKIQDPGVGTDSGRGTSNECTVVGRIIHSSADGEKLTSAPVYATIDYNSLVTQASHLNDTDLEILQAVNLTAGEPQEYMIGWGVKSVGYGATADQVNQFSVLIVRLPTGGALHTYILQSADKTPQQVVADPAALVSNDFTMCLDSGGLVFTPRLGAMITKDAANSAGVKYVSEGVC